MGLIPPSALSAAPLQALPAIGHWSLVIARAYSRRPSRISRANREGGVGQKTHPLGFRLGIIKTWRSRWFAGKNYAELLHEDLRLRRYIKERLYHSGVSRIEIERKGDQLRILI